MPPVDRSRWIRCLTLAALAAVFIAGAVLRLAWPGDIEYKLDEQWTFEHSRNFDRYDAPWVGMPSSQSVRNPGLSLWVFALPTQLLNLREPTELARVVQWASIAALALLFWFAWSWLPPEDREVWLWAFALACVNPLAVLFQRKIWPPSLLPCVGVALLMFWHRRDTRWGAALWGVCSALMMQVHPPAFLLAMAYALWTRLFGKTPVRWRYCAGGFALAALPLVPWLAFVLESNAGPRHNAFKLTRLVSVKFWTHWATEPFGIGLTYSLRQDYGEFLAQPLIGGAPTYLVLLLHLLAMSLCAGAIFCAIVHWVRRPQLWGELLSGSQSPGRLACQAGFVGFGLLMTATTLPFYRHYLVLVFPLMYVWVGYVMLDRVSRQRWELPVRRGIMALLCVTQLAISAMFLRYIHEHGGAERGHFGRTYQAQRAAELAVSDQRSAVSQSNPRWPNANR